ncbi:sigma-70 family RNA polymerase sigma factor [Actinomadura scrupuli]|uniref:sigma-70 family RNA polymerase sigma factor n=1 Tax=Actinomadura scrupuli TaxID=559629 RepID=UPI003D98FB56
MPGPQTVRAAQRGDRQALEDLVSGCLPLLYNIIGRALNGHPDVDDVVQETMLRVLRGISGLKQPVSFRSWLVAVAIHQVRDHHRSRQRSQTRQTTLEDIADVPDPRADFAELTTLRLGLSHQRKEIAEATRWLDPDDRELLALWWLEEGGELQRADLVAALELPARHVAVRVQRMKEQLDLGRAVVRVLHRPGDCADLTALRADWDGRPAPLWRKRFARHIRDCAGCSARSSDLIPAERLLAGLPLLPVPPSLAHAGLPSGLPGGHGPGVLRARHAARLPHVPAKALISVPLAAGAVAGLVGLAVLGHGGEGRPAAVTGPAAVTASAGPVTGSAPPARPAERPVPAPSPQVKKANRPVVRSAGSCLKGVATWTFSGSGRALAASGACWYYDWAAGRSGITGPRGVEFVPMIWGPRSVTAATLAEAKSQGHTLLGFNEPDMAAQSNMTPGQALALWPRLMATGMRLGSPAVATNGATAGGWLDQFMRGAAARHHRVDFITLHWYGSDFRTPAAVAQLRAYLQAVHARYHKPIWLTEYALIRFGSVTQYPSQPQQAAFLRSSAAMLAALPYLERYAWFGLPATKGSGTGLFTGAGTPTQLGSAFRALPATAR